METPFFNAGLTELAELLHTQQGVEGEGRRCKLVCMTELVLCRGEVEVCSAFKVLPGLSLCRRAWWYEGCKEARRNRDVGELLKKQESKDVGRLRNVDCCK